MCKRDVEIGNHILLCQLAQNLWNLAYGFLGLK